MNAKHTTLPWKVRILLNPPQTAIRSATNGVLVCTMESGYQKMRDMDAAFIVRACNAHDDLVAALVAVDRGFKDGSIKWAKPRQADSEPYHPANSRMCAALAKARGEA